MTSLPTNKLINMNDFIKAINKYVILLIVISLFGMPWMYMRYWLFESYSPDSLVFRIPTYIDYLVRLVVIILLIIDFKKYNLKNVVISCIGALFFPLLGMVIFAIMFIANQKNKANA